MKRVSDNRSNADLAQHVLNADGRVVTWDLTTESGAEMGAMLEQWTDDFESRFGRTPGPGDPLFYSDNRDEPTQMTEGELAASFNEFFDHAVKAGVPIPFMEAWRELGYAIVPQNVHLFSRREVTDFYAAIERFEN